MQPGRTSTNALALGLVTILGTFLGVALIYTILSSRGNNLSEFAKYLAAAAFVVGFISPKKMLFPLIIATGFLDLMKRMLILYDRPNVLDLYFVLGIAPLLLAGIFLGTLTGVLFGKYPVEKKHFGLLAIVLVFILSSAAFAFRDKGTSSALKAIADGSAYSVLLFIIPVLFKKWTDFWKVIRFALIIFVPVAVYALYQGFHGLSLFEIEYLRSGLTLMVKELDDVTPRPFSTLNSAHSLSYTCAMLFIFSCIPLAAGRDYQSLFKHRWVYPFFIALYFSVCVATMARSGHIVWMIGLLALFAFSSKTRTKLFYGSCVTLMLSMIFFAEKLMQKLPVWDAKLIKSTPFLHQTTRIQTFQARLSSYVQLKDPDTYSLFGLKTPIYYHDAITEALVNYGVIPLLLAVIVACVLLTKLHKNVFKIRQRSNRRIACLFLGAAVGIVVCDLIFGNTYKTFPVNAYMWMAWGMITLILFESQEQSAEEPEPESVRPRRERVRRGFPSAAQPARIPLAHRALMNRTQS